MELLFGLKAQGQIEKILEMMKAGKTWNEIAKAIGWQKQTLKLHWYRYVEDVDEAERKRMHYFVFGTDMPAPPQACT
jgi:hypothetical protein